MPQLDLSFIRDQFPAFSEPSLENFAFFENAGGSYACRQVIDRLNRFYVETKVQPYYPSGPSTRAGELMDDARRRMARWLNVEKDEVLFGPSTSMNTYVLAQAFREHLEPGDEVIVTNQDHEANVGVWRRLEKDGMVIREWRADPETGALDVAGLEALLGERTRLVAFTHCSNIVGTMHPVRQWVDRVHDAGAVAVVDGVSYAPHGLPDVRGLGADAYLFSTYKVYGPHQGVMVMRRGLNERLPNQAHYFNEGIPSARFSPAGPDHAQVAGVGGVIDYLQAVHDHHFDEESAPPHARAAAVRALFQHAEREKLKPLLDFVAAHPRARLIGHTDTDLRAPTVSFAVKGQSATALAERLATDDIGVGAGHFYAARLVEALGVEPDAGLLRCSYVHYTSGEEITRLIEALDRHL